MADLDCAQVRRLIDAAIDGELDLVTQISFDTHLAGCATCSAAQASRLVLAGRVREAGETFAAPAALRAKIVAGLPQDGSFTAKPKPRKGLWVTGSAWAGSVVALAASLVLFLATPNQVDQMNRDLVAAHVRSLMPDHLTDIASTDQHNVKPWFNGRVPLSPPVPNLATEGYPLIGGRLDYVDDHTMAVLVYGHRQHIVNLFVWAAPGASDSAVHVTMHNGFNLVEWRGSGIAYAAVSDIPRSELESFQHSWSAASATGR